MGSRENPKVDRNLGIEGDHVINESAALILNPGFSCAWRLLKFQDLFSSRHGNGSEINSSWAMYLTSRTQRYVHVLLLVRSQP